MNSATPVNGKSHGKGPYVSTRSNPASNPNSAEMKKALQDSVIIEPLEEANNRNPFSNRPPPASRDKPLPPPGNSSAKTRNGEKNQNSDIIDSATRKAKTGGATKPKGQQKDLPFDVIDRLDISGLYGGGAFHRHDGPYAATSANRNKGPRAPMMAFDPSALSPTAAIASPTSRSPSTRPSGPARATSNQSPRTQHILDKMDDHDAREAAGGLGGEGVVYGKRGMDGRRSRRNSDGSVTMGFPNAAGVSGKGQQLVEMFGVRDNEAWEDFGTSKFKHGHSTASKESVVPGPVSKEDRISRTNSIWDMEATLRGGKPVGQAPPPPLPTFPSNNDLSNGKDSFTYAETNKPKRSKSLVARFRGARKNPDNPMGGDEVDSAPIGRRQAAVDRSNNSSVHELPYSSKNNSTTVPSSAPQPIRTRAVNFDDERLATSPTEGRGGSRFTGGAILGASRSLGPEVKLDGAKYEDRAPVGSGSGLGRRPSVMQRLFRGKAK